MRVGWRVDLMDSMDEKKVELKAFLKVEKMDVLMVETMAVLKAFLKVEKKAEL